jgi:glutathione synthase/RimK-type ligase-like ATP-grasp enzyme
MSAGLVLVVSHPHDPHACDVVARIEQRGSRLVLFDTGRLPRETLLTVHHDPLRGWSAAAKVDGPVIDLAEVRSVWWRRPQAIQVDAAVGAPDDRAFAFGEIHAQLAGLWACLDARFVNDPGHDERAARKLWQLKIARAVGLRVPRTCATSDPDAARAFIAAEAPLPVIYKTFSATDRAWRETRLLRTEEHAQLDAVAHAPVIFQEHIPAAVDLRITAVDGSLFPAEIHSQQTAYVHDFRMAMHEARIVPHALDPQVEVELLRLMRELGLVYGAIDMRLTPSGEYVFLEVNPAGQWLFIEQATGQPISAAIAEALIARAQ